MNEHKNPQAPFASLGRQLKRLRVRRRESVAEVSGAVEIDIEALTAIEQGTERPKEDILLLLMSHFEMKEEEADTVWKLAGYETEPEQKQVVMMAPEDLRVIYTDMVHVTVSNFGVVMNFMQNNGSSHPMAISRVGMSREHAEKVLEVLQKTLAASQPKGLPSPNDKNKTPKSET